MLYRGVFRAGETYHPGDTVTCGGLAVALQQYDR